MPGTTVTASTTILSAWANGFTADVAATFNAAWPMSLGGTGGTSAATSRTSLDVPGLSVANTFTETQTITSTDAGAGVGPILALYRNSASPAAADDLGIIRFQGEDSAGNTETYATISGNILDPTSGSEDARIRVNVVVAGADTEGVNLLGTGVRVAAGTVSVPSLSFIADTDTGFYQHAVSNLSVTVDGTIKGYWNSSGFSIVETTAAATFGSVNAVKNLISGGGQIDVTNRQGGSCLRVSVTVDNQAVQFYQNTTQVGNITCAVASTAYNTTSDEWFKIFKGEYDPLEAIAIIRADPVRDFTWDEAHGGGDAIGWGAQTSYGISPDLASPGNGNHTDEDYKPWGVDKGARTPYLWAALTWALDKIEAQDVALEALRSRLDAAGL